MKSPLSLPRSPARIRPHGALHAAALGLAFALVLAAPAVAQPALDDGDSLLARRVKAAFLYKFLAYVEWPPQVFADSASPLVIGVLGPDPVVAEVAEVVGERLAHGRPVLVRRLRDLDAVAGAHVVYVTRSEAARTPQVAAITRDKGTLVVTEAEGGLAQGSVINFRLVDGRVRFDVALPAAERAGLRISSRLLAIAHSVLTSPS